MSHGSVPPSLRPPSSQRGSSIEAQIGFELERHNAARLLAARQTAAKDEAEARNAKTLRPQRSELAAPAERSSDGDKAVVILILVIAALIFAVMAKNALTAPDPAPVAPPAGLK